MIRTALAALLLSATALPLAAQDGASLFQKKPKTTTGGSGSAAASLFPQADLDAAADISVGVETPAPAEPVAQDTAMQDEAPAVETPLTEVAETEPPATDAPASAESLAAAQALAAPPAEEAVTAPDPEDTPADQAEVLTASATIPLIRPRLRPEVLEPLAEEVAEICTDPTGIRDRDVARNIGAFAVDPNLCISEERFSEHGRSWHMVIISNRKARRGPVWAILHDNEDSAFDAALYSVSRYGGKMIALETGETRSFKGQDPNRNFGETKGITGPCGNMVTKPAPAFTRALNRHFDRRFPVLTMHSNDNGHTGNGGAGHISAARSSATMKGIMSPRPTGTLSDEDNAVLTAGTVPFEQNGKAQKLASYLGELGINMIYEHVKTNTNDCSFSFHVKLNNLGDYYNIEVEHGRVEDQKEILDALMAYIGIRPRR